MSVELRTPQSKPPLVNRQVFALDETGSAKLSVKAR